MRILALVCLTLCLAACSKSGTSSPTATTSALVGSWKRPQTATKLFEFKADGSYTETNVAATNCTVTTTGQYSDTGTAFTVVSGTPSYSDQTACDTGCQAAYGRNCAMGDFSYSYNRGSIGYTATSTSTLSLNVGGTTVAIERM